MNPDAPSPPDSEGHDRPASSGDADRPLVIPSEQVLQGRREVWIQHGDEMYRLRVTSSGKLYLSK